MKLHWPTKTRPLSPPPSGAVVSGRIRLGAPVLSSEGQVTSTLLLLLQHMCGHMCCDVCLRPLLMRLQGHQALWAQRGDRSRAAWRSQGPTTPAVGGGGGSEVYKGGSD